VKSEPTQEIVGEVLRFAAGSGERMNETTFHLVKRWGGTCWLRKFNLQNFRAELASEEARRQLENALCIVKKSELSATISTKASTLKHALRTCPERDLGPISLFFMAEWSKEWRFRIKGGSDGESGV
jgi:hypothetical protein